MITDIVQSSEKKNYKNNETKTKTVEMILSDTFAGSFNACLTRLKKADGTNLDEKYILLVPENLSFTAEKEILKNVCDCSFNIEALSFSRLLYKISSAAKSKSYLSTQAGILIVAKILMQNKERLGLLTGNLATVGEELYKLIIQLKSSAVKPEDLSSLKIEKGTLALKLSDISFVYGEYEKFIGSNYFDNTDRTQLLASEILKSNFFNNVHVYIAGFNSVTKNELNVFAAIFSKAKESVISVIYDKDNRVYLNEVKREVEKICSVLHFELKQTVLKSGLGKIGMQIKNGIFCCSNLPQMKINDEIVVYSADDVFDECKFVANKINVLTKKGVRFDEIAVICENLEEYLLPLKSAFGDFDVPYFYDEGKKLSLFSGSRYLMQLLKCKSKRIFYDDLIDLSKNAFCVMDNDEKNDFENYCLKYLSRRFDVRKEFIYVKDDDGELIETAEKVRKHLVGIIDSLNVKTVDSVLGFINELKAFMSEQNFFNAVHDYSEKTFDEQEKKFCAQTEKAFEKVFSTVSLVFGTSYLDLNSFIEILGVALDKLNVSVVPIYIDSVFLSNAYDAKFLNKKAIFLIGATEGNMPIIVRDNKILSDNDMLILKDAGVEINPFISEVNGRAIQSLHQALLSCQGKLTVSYSVGVGSGTAKSTPARLVDYIKECFSNCAAGFEVKTTATENILFNDGLSVENMGTEANVFNSFIQGMRLYREGFKINEATYSQLYSVLAHTPYNKLISGMNLKTIGFSVDDGLNDSFELFFPNGTTSASQLECYFSCPYKHFMQYGLRLKERENFELEVLSIGTLMHNVLEKFAPKAESIDFSRSGSDEVVERIFDDILSKKEYSFILEDKKQTALINRLKKEAKRACYSILAFSKNSGFVTVATESPFIDSDKLKFITGDNDVKVVGKIDRIDGMGNQRLIIDYKTGKTDIGFKKLWTGEKIQLYIYTLALGSGCSPCGVYYFPVSDTFNDGEKIQDGFLRMQGVHILNDSLKDLDTGLADGDISKFLPIKKDKGQIKAVSGMKFVTEGQFDAISDYTKKIISCGINEIAGGNKDVSPTEKSCDWCSFKNSCRIDKDIFDPTRKIGCKVTAENIEFITSEFAEKVRKGEENERE